MNLTLFVIAIGQTLFFAWAVMDRPNHWWLIIGFVVLNILRSTLEEEKIKAIVRRVR